MCLRPELRKKHSLIRLRCETGRVSADWTALHRFLEQHAGAVTLSWAQLEDIAGGLPSSATNHRAWWSGDRPHVRAWKSAGFRIDEVRPGVEVSFLPDLAAETRLEQSPRTTTSADAVPPRAAPDLLLVTCVKTKRATPSAARDLYVSSLFAKQRAYAESVGKPWFILSAEHGLVAPDEWLAPYERYLPDTPSDYRKAWGSWVVARLALVAGPLHGRVVEVHASEDYVWAITDPLERSGATLVTPLAGLTQGQRLRWYTDRRPDGIELQVEPVARPTGGREAEALVDRFAALLNERASARTVQALLASDRRPLQRPGLYSWWVDEDGANDLSRALGRSVSPGLIYAGQAGATRWPSGRRSTNTLWGRVVGMHLGKKHEFSTFRRTLFSLLALLDGGEGLSETAVTAWMTAHLRIITAPIDDAGVLGMLEHEVLHRLDPPLNLKGMPASDIRAELRRARQRLGVSRAAL